MWDAAIKLNPPQKDRALRKSTGFRKEAHRIYTSITYRPSIHYCNPPELCSVPVIAQTMTFLSFDCAWWQLIRMANTTNLQPYNACIRSQQWWAHYQHSIHLQKEVKTSPGCVFVWPSAFLWPIGEAGNTGGCSSANREAVWETFWEGLTCCAYVCVTVILDRKRLRCGLGIRCVSIRTVIKKYSTQSIKSCGRSHSSSKREH